MENPKLRSDKENLASLTDLLGKSDNLTQNMNGILGSFENRLRKLEDNIVPVYQETENLQCRQRNIEKTLDRLDHVIKFYNVSKEVEAIIRDGPSGNLEVFLQSMQKIEAAIRFFSRECPNSPEFSTVKTQFDSGSYSLQREFQQILQHNSKPFRAVELLDVLASAMGGGGDEDDTSSNTTSEEGSRLEQLDEKTIKELATVSKWLHINTDNRGYLDTYASSRVSSVLSSLYNLRDHDKSSSSGSQHDVSLALSPHSPNPGSRLPHRQTSSTPTAGAKTNKETPRRMSRKGIENRLRKASDAIKKTGAAHIMKHSPISLHTSDLQKYSITEEVGNLDVEMYMNQILAVFKLLQYEYRLLNEIIPEVEKKRIYDGIANPVLKHLQSEGKDLVEACCRIAAKHEFKCVFLLFPVLKLLQQHRYDIDNTLETCQSSTKVMMFEISKMFERNAVSLLDDLVESIRCDPEKQSHLPKDGTVHELTSNTLGFLENLLFYHSSAGEVIAKRDKGGMSEIKDEDKSSALSSYLERVLAHLGSNLKNKSESYQDPHLGHIFMLNNYNYIYKALASNSKLLAMLSKKDADTADHYKRQIREQKRLYSQSWSHVLGYIVDRSDMGEVKPSTPGTPSVVHKLPSTTSTYSGDPSALAQASTKLKDKDRKAIKDRFSGFNRELEELVKVQRGYAIADTELRQALRKEDKEYILPKYELFLQRYAGTDFTTNRDKYIKYTPQAVAEMVDELFV